MNPAQSNRTPTWCSLVHRPDFYDKEDRPGEADIIMAKHRNGPTETFHLAFLGATSKFKDMPQDYNANQGVVMMASNVSRDVSQDQSSVVQTCKAVVCVRHRGRRPLRAVCIPRHQTMAVRLCPAKS